MNGAKPNNKKGIPVPTEDIDEQKNVKVIAKT